MNEKKAIEEKINKELPTLSDKAKEKRKAEERDKGDLKSLRESIDSMNPDSKQDEETKKGQKIKVQIKKKKLPKKRKKNLKYHQLALQNPRKRRVLRQQERYIQKKLKMKLSDYAKFLESRRSLKTLVSIWTI